MIFRNLFITKHDPSPGKSGSHTTVKGKDINERIPLDAFFKWFYLGEGLEEFIFTRPCSGKRGRIMGVLK